MGESEGKRRWVGGSPGGIVGEVVEDDAATREKFVDGHLHEGCEKE